MWEKHVIWEIANVVTEADFLTVEFLTFWKNERGNQLETQSITLHYSLSEKHRLDLFLKILHWEAALLAEVPCSAAVFVSRNLDNRFSFHSLSRDLSKSHFWTLSQSIGFLICLWKIVPIHISYIKHIQAFPKFQWW